MSSSIRLVNYGGYPAAHHWGGSLYWPTATDFWKNWGMPILLVAEPAIIEYGVGDPYGYTIYAFINVGIWDVYGNLVYSAENIGVWFENNKEYEWDVSTNQLIEVGGLTAGEITAKTLSHETGYQDIPAFVTVPFGEEAFVRIQARNDSYEPVIFILDWATKRPSWQVGPSGSVQSGWVAPGDYGVLDGQTFMFDEEGEWKVRLILKAGAFGETPVEVDRWPTLIMDYDTLCMVGAAPPEEFAGTITKLELEYDSAIAPIPVTDIPQGERGLVHIWGRNDTSTTQQMGISWEVRRPDGVVVEEHAEWEFWPYTGPGVEKRFVGGRFDLDKQGTYTLKVDLLMNKPNPVIVDSYSGNLCTVVFEEFAGTITKLELEYDSAIAPIPVTDIPQGERGLVHIWGRNDTSTTQQMGISWEVRRPDGVVVEEHAEWEFWPYTGPGVEKRFVGGRFDLDKQGTYTLKVDLLMNKPNPVIVDSYSGNLCTVVFEEVPPEYEIVQHTVYPWAYLYEGDAEVCIFEFKLTPEQIPGTEWLGDRIVDTFADELEKEGSRLLELKVYRDITPVLWTNYRVEVAAAASPIYWTPIIILVLAILFVVAITFLVKTIDQVFFKRRPLDEETKGTFSRETLAAMILDLAPETPPETLEGKSDQELRDLLNQLLAEIMPPVSWWPLAVVGGLAVLGIGAAFALTAKRK